jgi:ABC-2 type transport system ATP-binding protein
VSLVKVQNLEKHYPQFTLGNVSFHLDAGYVLGIIGPNGSGKTTTIQLMMDLLPADGGSVELFGMDYKKHTLEIRRKTGYVGEEQYFYENRTVDWTERFVSGFYPQWDRNRFEELLHMFAISRTKKIKELSKGMKVKLSLALSLSYDPMLIILDEPTSGLDPLIRRELLGILSQLTSDEKHSVILSSHITEDISRIADYVLFLVDGKVRVFSEKDSLLANWKRIHFQKGLPVDCDRYLLSKTETHFGSSAVTNRFSELEPLLGALLLTNDVKVENLSLDDILSEIVHGGVPCSF